MFEVLAFREFFYKKSFWRFKNICLWKTSLFEEYFLDQVKFLCGKIPWLWNKYSLDCKKLIGLIILKTNASIETSKTYILVFFAVDKINIIFSRRLKHKILNLQCVTATKVCSY